jgi:hypothetical protein
MPDADHYLRQANILLSMSLGTSNPVVAGKLWEIAEDYLAKAVKLRIDNGLPALPRSRSARLQPFDQAGIDQEPIEAARLGAAVAPVEQSLAALEDLFLLRERGIER